MYFIYILECSNDSLYIGYTTDIKRRYQEHCQGSAKCKYTRSFPPKRIAACWQFDAQLGKVLSLERRLKALTKQQKQTIVMKPETLIAYTDLTFDMIGMV